MKDKLTKEQRDFVEAVRKKYHRDKDEIIENFLSIVDRFAPRSKLDEWWVNVFRDYNYQPEFKFYNSKKLADEDAHNSWDLRVACVKLFEGQFDE